MAVHDPVNQKNMATTMCKPTAENVTWEMRFSFFPGIRMLIRNPMTGRRTNNGIRDIIS
jgi:hypothetical protein